MTHRHMMMYHNTKFGNKMFVVLEDIILKNIDILTLCCDLDLDCGNPFSSQNTLAHDAASPHQVW